MRLAILSDLHANREALAACLAHAARQRADQYAFLGDLVGYGADPAWVVDTVMDYVDRGAIAVQGNHDYATTHEAPAGMPAEMQEALAWTRGRLRPGHLAFLAGLPLAQQHGHALFVHASAEDPGKWIYVTGAAQAERSLRATRCRLVFSGHVHVPALYRRDDDGRMGHQAPVDGSCIVLAPRRQYLAIAGSVGQPRDGGNGACYAIYDAVTGELCFFRVPYGHGAV
ncbi:metallophosphoesterase family protein [Massilia niastensis]|uniref:metallophosphoesterase family protein n=1 Tax=Massilia niastensis TaxID=544911 RepID=UPI00038020EB|nr:metallophosphoesterase family protein [Massilia niastensis]